MTFTKQFILICLVGVVLWAGHAEAFGAGNIASISKVEGCNYRHGDIEETALKTIRALGGHKWTSMMIKRVYFGNWLRDYSQAVDVGTLTMVQATSIRILVWFLAFMSFGYATGEFEVTAERLGCYRPEEHIDNPKDYADNQDARKFDKRLRGPVSREELEVDPRTGMKNYIANENGNWATSSGFVKYSLERSIHFGRLYTSGPNRGREEDLCEALRCLGQGLHCLEDFGAHTQYVELVLRELGFHNVFPHVGSSTQLELRGKQVYPLVTGTFGGVDFLHSVLGEASDHVTQSEVDDAQNVLGQAQAGKRTAGGNTADLGALTGLLKLVPGTGDLSREAEDLQRSADEQTRGGNMGADDNYSADRSFNPGAMFNSMTGSADGSKVPTDPEEIIKKIYPILLFRDNVVRTISNIISKIPGLESVVDKITETVTLFVMRLIAPYILPLIATASQGLKQGSSAVVGSSAQQQYVVFDNPHSTDPTHSMLSKDHFSNILNPPAGRIATEIVRYVAPRVIYAWEHPDVPVHQVTADAVRVFHHPAMRDMNCEVHRNMYMVVEQWVNGLNDRGRDLEHLLTRESVRAGKNHKAEKTPEGGIPNPFGGPGAVLGGGRREISTDDSSDVGPSGGYSSQQSYAQSSGENTYNKSDASYNSSYNNSGGESSYSRPAQSTYESGAAYGQEAPPYGVPMYGNNQAQPQMPQQEYPGYGGQSQGYGGQPPSGYGPSGGYGQGGGYPGQSGGYPGQSGGYSGY